MNLREIVSYLAASGLLLFLLTHNLIFKIKLSKFQLKILVYMQIFSLSVIGAGSGIFKHYPIIENACMVLAVLAMIVLLIDGTISAWRNDPEIPNPPDLFTKILLTICSIGFVGVVIVGTLILYGVI